MIDILLSTYNGEKYITQQLQSLFDQTVDDWTLWIRDDGSTDNTVAIIKTITGFTAILITPWVSNQLVFLNQFFF